MRHVLLDLHTFHLWEPGISKKSHQSVDLDSFTGPAPVLFIWILSLRLFLVSIITSLCPISSLISTFCCGFILWDVWICVFFLFFFFCSSWSWSFHRLEHWNHHHHQPQPHMAKNLSTESVVCSWWMTVSFKSCWYNTFSLENKNMSVAKHGWGEHPLPKVCLWVRRGVKEIKWERGGEREREREREGERDRWSGRSFPCPPLLFELFFHSSSSFCASFHSASDKALHSLPHSSTPPSSLHLPHTPRPHPLPPGSFV